MSLYLTYYFDFLRWGYGITPFDEKRVERLKQIAEQANSNEEIVIRLKELAAEANVSLHYLSHDIKDKFGLSFQELVFYSKCEYAAKLLLSTSDRVIDIALASGFSDVKYLIKHFKQYFKCTPSQFREKYRADISTLTTQVIYRDYPLSWGIKEVGSRNQQLSDI